jgi:hypothetical protein
MRKTPKVNRRASAESRPGVANAVFMAPALSLGLSQLYLSEAKVAGVLRWFNPRDLRNFVPLPVRDFGNGKLTLTDGHTMAYVAWLHGLTDVPVMIDNDDIVTCPLGQELYLNDIEWCERFALFNVAALKDRIVSKKDYQVLWEVRCDRLHALVRALQNGTIDRAAFAALSRDLEGQDKFVYGAAGDGTVFFCEDANGNPFELRNPLPTRPA